MSREEVRLRAGKAFPPPPPAPPEPEVSGETGSDANRGAELLLKRRAKKPPPCLLLPPLFEWCGVAAAALRGDGAGD